MSKSMAGDCAHLELRVSLCQGVDKIFRPRSHTRLHHMRCVHHAKCDDALIQDQKQAHDYEPEQHSYRMSTACTATI